jgi:hypothetical protein
VEDDDETRTLLDRMGSGPVLAKDIPEIIRAMRHAIVNDHVGIRYVSEIAKEADNLAKKALDKIDQTNSRIDDITGVSGQEHIDGGGALGRMQRSMARIEKLLYRATWAIVAGSVTLAADIATHFLPK